MSTRKNVVPSDSILQAAVEQLLQPALKQVAKEAGVTLCATVSVMGETNEIAQFEMDEGSPTDSKVQGKIRLSFRATFDHARFLVHAEAIFDQPRPAHGFSGFSLKGHVTCNGQIVAKRTGWTIRYNVWNWTGW